MAYMFNLGVVCILILSLSKNGLLQIYPPRFDEFPWHLQFDEGCSNRTLANITARGNNGLIKISAYDDATRHKVNIVEIGHTCDDYSTCTTTVHIQQKACMDRETEPTWILQLLAVDTSLKTNKTLQIFILDVNDEHPSFPSKLYQITVSENASLNTEVLKVEATDPDNGSGGVITYSLVSAVLYDNAFSIDARSGSITLRKRLEYSKLSFYQYIIVGTDLGGLKGNATLMIKIQSIASTITPNTTRHPSVQGTTATDNFMFRYDPNSHVMVAILHHTCYVYKASNTEIVDVHTSHGTHLLEMKLVTMVASTSANYDTMSHDELTSLSKSTARLCNRVGWTTHTLN